MPKRTRCLYHISFTPKTFETPLLSRLELCCTNPLEKTATMKHACLLGALALAMLLTPLAATSALAGNEWQPVDSSQLSIKTPVVEPNADAEAIFWDVRVQDI